MSVVDSMDEGVDVCVVVYGQAVSLSDGQYGGLQQIPTKPISMQLRYWHS